MTINERYKVYTCSLCKVKRDSIFIETYTRICRKCYKLNNTLSKESLEKIKKLNEELNKILGF